MLKEEEKRACIESMRDVSHANQRDAESRSSNLADEFTRLEVQMATVLFALVGFFLGSFGDFPVGEAMGTKFTLALSLFFLIGSLAFGLLHIKRKEKFWDEMLIQRINRFVKWNSTSQGNGTMEEALAYHEGLSGGKGHFVSTPVWTWILQTIFLSIAVVMLFILFIVFLFR